MDEPAVPPVLEAFLRELPGPAAAALRAMAPDLGVAPPADRPRVPSGNRSPAVAAGVPDARLSMLLFDIARRYIPRVLGALGDPTTALALLPLADPSPDPRDPFLYTKAAARVGGDIGAAARAFEEQRALVRQGRGDRALARRLLAALAGRLVARAAEVLGPQVHEDVARTLQRSLLRAAERARAEGQSPPRADRQSPPRAEGQSPPRADRQSLPLDEGQASTAPRRKAPVRRDQTITMKPRGPASKTG